MFVLGNKDLLKHNKAVILNSSQSKTPCGADPWIKATAAAVEKTAGSGYTLVSSLGLNTWEIVIHIAAKSGGSQIIVSPEGDEKTGPDLYNKIIGEFGLSSSKTAMVFVRPGEKSRSAKSNWVLRDEAAIDLADLLVPVSINPRGKMKKLIDRFSSEEAINDGFTIDYHKSYISPPQYDKDLINFRADEWNYLTHWTRTCHGPWPGQSKSAYYESILNSSGKYPNNAISTLGRIIEERLLRGSSKRIRDGMKVVGFTESTPQEVFKFLRWLPKRTGWNFEPYGIAINKRHAKRFVIRRAIYGESKQYDSLSERDRPFFQAKGEIVDWSIEKEWRIVGELDYSSVPPEDIIYFVWHDQEAKSLRELTGNSVIAIGGDRS